MEEALTELIRESAKAKQELQNELKNEPKKSAEDQFLRVAPCACKNFRQLSDRLSSYKYHKFF